MSDESTMNLPTQPSEVDYETIHDAVMESQRGRWFLHEYARRNRNADTALLLVAIERVELMLRRQRPLPLSLASSSSELRDAIERASKSPGATRPSGGQANRLAGADGLARVLEAAIAQLHGATRPLRDVAYAMREEGVRDRFCTEVETCAADLTRNFTALERAAADILALLRDPAARELASAVPAATEPPTVSSSPMPAPPEPMAAQPVFPPETQFEQSPAAPEVEAAATHETLTIDPMPALDLRAEPTSPPRKAIADQGPIELPFASIGSDAPVSEPAAAEVLPAELPITPTFAPADFMPEPAPAIVEPPPAPEPPPAAAPEPPPLVATAPAPLPPADAAPAKQPVRKVLDDDAKSALAPIIALSDEEKIALFS